MGTERRPVGQQGGKGEKALGRKEAMVRNLGFIFMVVGKWQCCHCQRRKDYIAWTQWKYIWDTVERDWVRWGGYWSSGCHE